MKAYCKMFCVKFLLSSSSFAALKRCGAFRIVLRTLFTLGVTNARSVDDRRPLPPDSTIVGSAELLLFLLNDPKRKERDNERERGLNFCRVDAPAPDDDDDGESVGLRSNSDVTNLSSSAKSASFLEVRFEALLLLPLPPDTDDAAPAAVVADGIIGCMISDN